MEHRQNNLGCTLTLIVHVDWDSAPVVLHRHRTVRVDNYVNQITVAGQRFINRVIDHLENHVMQTGSIIRITDIHPWPLSDSLKTFKDLNRAAIVSAWRLVLFHHSSLLRLNNSVFHVKHFCIS